MLHTESKSMKIPCAKRQYYTAVIVNLFIVAFGILGGWSSPMVVLLTSDDTPLPSGKITMEEATWMTSLMQVGALICNIIFGYISNNFGRKIPLLIISVPMIISWLLVWFAQDPFYLYISRAMGGFFGAGGYMIVPLFLIEITDDRIRGTLLSALYAVENLGALLAFIIGDYFNFYAMPLFSIILIATFAILLTFVPESPIFLLRKNQIEKAKQSICYYKNIRMTDKDSNVVLELEIEKLKRALGKSQSTDDKRGTWTPETIAITRNALITGFILISLYIFCGITPMSFYTASIFQETGSTLSPNMSAIIIAAIQLIGTMIATELVERAGRKILLVVSCFGTALSLVVMGVYMMLKAWGIHVEFVNWIPLVAYSSATFISAIGIQSLTITVVYEIAPEHMKESYMSILMTISWTLSFISTKYLPQFLELLEFHYSMYVFAGVCILSAFYIMLYMPETKGKSYEEIMKSLAPKARVQNT